MPSERPRQRFQDIIDNIDRIGSYIAGLDGASFREDWNANDAPKVARDNILMNNLAVTWDFRR